MAQWTESLHFITIELKSPYWSAWKKYGWPQGTAGYSIDLSGFQKAQQTKKIIRVVYKGEKLFVTPEKILKEGKRFVLQGGKTLICIPRYAFTDEMPIT